MYVRASLVFQSKQCLGTYVRTYLFYKVIHSIGILDPPGFLEYVRTYVRTYFFFTQRIPRKLRTYVRKEFHA